MICLIEQGLDFNFYFESVVLNKIECTLEIFFAAFYLVCVYDFNTWQSGRNGCFYAEFMCQFVGLEPHVLSADQQVLSADHCHSLLQIAFLCVCVRVCNQCQFKEFVPAHFDFCMYFAWCTYSNQALCNKVWYVPSKWHNWYTSFTWLPLL